MINYSIPTVLEAGERVFEWISANKKLPNYVTIQGSQIKMPVFLDLATRAVLQIESKNPNPLQVRPVNSPNIPSPISPSGKIPFANYLDAFSRLYGYITANSRAPATLGTNLGKIGFNEMVYAAAFTCTHYKRNQNLPNFIQIGSGSGPAESVLYRLGVDALGGSYNTARELYNLFKYKVYSKYFNDIYTLSQALYRLKNKLGLNCADACQVFAQLARDRGYTVRFVHIVCASGTGHIQIDIKGRELGDTWHRVDVAAALSSGYAWGELWCSNGRLIAYDPVWIIGIDDGVT